MAINFPSNPDLNDEFTAGETTWRYDGTAWVVISNIQDNAAPTFLNLTDTPGTYTAGRVLKVNNAGTAIEFTTQPMGDPNQNAFSSIVVQGEGTANADDPTDSLVFVAGDGMNITVDTESDTITFDVTAVGGASDAFKTIVTNDGQYSATGEDTINILGRQYITTELTTDTNDLHIDLSPFSIDYLLDVDTTTTPPTTGQVLKWNGSAWVPGVDATTGGAGTDADTLDGFDSAYFLNYNNLSNTPAILTLSELSVGNELTPTGNGGISYDNTSGVFRYTPPTAAGLGAIEAEVNDLTQAVVWTNIPEGNITEASVTQHQGALSITVSQISDLGSTSIDALGDVDTTTNAPTDGQVLSWDGTASLWVPAAAATGGGGGEANQNAFSSVAVSGQTTVSADSTTDTLTVAAGNGIQITTNATTDTITITNTASAGASDFTDLGDVTSASLTVDQIYMQAITRFQVDNNGTTSYTFAPHYTGDNPTIFVLNGLTVAFDLMNVSGHPFAIQDSTGTNITTGLTHVSTTGTVSTGSNAQGKDSGTLYWTIPQGLASPPNYRYQCLSHTGMVGAITIKNIANI